MDYIKIFIGVGAMLLGLFVLGSIIAHQHKLDLKIRKLEKVQNNMIILNDIKYIVVIISIYMLLNLSGCIPFIPVSP